MRTILFVCTGNTCRSSMAEALFKDIVKKDGDNFKNLNIISAGTGAWDGYNASPQAVEVLREKGIDMSGHRSTSLTPELIDESDLILTMTYNHKATVLHMCPEAKGKVFTLKEYATGNEIEESHKDNIDYNGNKYNIKDPFGQSVDVYRKSAKEIEDNLKILIKKIK